MENIVSGDYVEIKELLGDNISLLYELVYVNATSTVNSASSMARPRPWEMSSLVALLLFGIRSPAVYRDKASIA